MLDPVLFQISGCLDSRINGSKIEMKLFSFFKFTVPTHDKKHVQKLCFIAFKVNQHLTVDNSACLSREKFCLQHGLNGMDGGLMQNCHHSAILNSTRKQKYYEHNQIGRSCYDSVTSLCWNWIFSTLDNNLVRGIWLFVWPFEKIAKCWKAWKVDTSKVVESNFQVSTSIEFSRYHYNNCISYKFLCFFLIKVITVCGYSSQTVANTKAYRILRLIFGIIIWNSYCLFLDFIHTKE